MSTGWKDALVGKASTQNMLQDIVDQVPTDHGARDAFEMCLDMLASHVDQDTQEKLAKLEALEDAGVDEWDGYDDAMAELEGDDSDSDDDDDDDDDDGADDDGDEDDEG